MSSRENSIVARGLKRLTYRARLLYWQAALGRRLRTHGFVRLGRRLTLKLRGTGVIELGPQVELEYDVNVESLGVVRIGANTFVGHGTTIGCSQSVTIGKYCLIGEYVSIRDNDHKFSSLREPIREQGQVAAPVCIGDDVWISAKVTVSSGVHIGSGSVIGANAVVTHDIPPGVVAVGVPARVIKQRSEG